MDRKSRIFKGLLLTLALAVCAAGCAGEGEPPVTEEEWGTLTIADVTTWLEYPASEFCPVFSAPEKAETLTYTYDESKFTLSAEAHTVQAIEVGDYEVIARSEHFETSFTVHCKEVDIDIQELWKRNNTTHGWESYVTNLRTMWSQRGTENTTLFVGDSFFDTRAFWTDFYTTYAGKDALCFGIGSTHSYSWEVLADKLLSGMVPHNLVMHLGTNNVYDMGDNAAEATEGLQRMFTLLHSKLPDTQIYYFTITHRSYGEVQQWAVNQVNKNMIEWCSHLDWITCLDTSPLITYDMLKDSIHPTLPSYSVFVEALEGAGVEIADK